MGLDISRQLEVERAAFVHFSDQFLLRREARLSNSRRVTILIRPRRPDHRTNHIAISDGVAEPFQNNHCHPLSPRIPVRSVVEAITTAIRRQKTHVFQICRLFWCEERIGSRYKCLVIGLVYRSGITPSAIHVIPLSSVHFEDTERLDLWQSYSKSKLY